MSNWRLITADLDSNKYHLKDNVNHGDDNDDDNDDDDDDDDDDNDDDEDDDFLRLQHFSRKMERWRMKRKK